LLVCTEHALERGGGYLALEKGDQMAKKKTQKKGRPAKAGKLWTLDVSLTGGPVTREFAEANKVICRTIQIRGNQTLEDLHEAIFDAFDRFDNHLYMFTVGGTGPRPRDGRHFADPFALEDQAFGKEPDEDASITSIDSLGLKVDDAFTYWFDFGDDWWHQINVVAIEDEAPPGKYSKVTKRIGNSPPQYIDWEEEEL